MTSSTLLNNAKKDSRCQFCQTWICFDFQLFFIFFPRPSFWFPFQFPFFLQIFLLISLLYCILANFPSLWFRLDDTVDVRPSVSSSLFGTRGFSTVRRTCGLQFPSFSFPSVITLGCKRRYYLSSVLSSAEFEWYYRFDLVTTSVKQWRIQMILQIWSCHYRLPSMRRSLLSWSKNIHYTLVNFLTEKW